MTKLLAKLSRSTPAIEEISRESARAERMSPAAQEPEPEKSLKRITWQSQNCLACVWFKPNDPLNADILERGTCVHAKLKPFELVVSGRDWCNLFTEIRQKQIDLIQEKAMNSD